MAIARICGGASGGRINGVGSGAGEMVAEGAGEGEGDADGAHREIGVGAGAGLGEGVWPRAARGTAAISAANSSLSIFTPNVW